MELWVFPKYMVQISADQVTVFALPRALALLISQSVAQCLLYTAFPARYLQWIPEKQLRMLSRTTDEPYWLLAFLGTLCSIL